LTKLQQLALARKKKLEQPSPEEQAEDTRQKLGELSVKEAPSVKENRLSEGGGFSKRQKLSNTTAAGRMRDTDLTTPINEGRPAAAQKSSQPGDSTIQGSRTFDGTKETNTDTGLSSAPFLAPDQSVATGMKAAPEMAEPSAFAQTLLGSVAVEPQPPATKFFALPYMAYCPSLADAFAKPSPDDVVLAAQAKGSIAGKGKN
jgi:elongation factor 1 alpha-like protein